MDTLYFRMHWSPAKILRFSISLNWSLLWCLLSLLHHHRIEAYYTPIILCVLYCLSKTLLELLSDDLCFHALLQVLQNVFLVTIVHLAFIDANRCKPKPVRQTET